MIRSPASKATCASTVDVDGGKVKKAWSSGQMWRGVELILLGRDPRDAWAITQRICGVCTTVHAIASVRAVENALQMEVPLNAQYIRNLIILAHAVHDHIVHFYHLSALDWVDVTSALKADPDKTAQPGARACRPGTATASTRCGAVQERLKDFVNGGQLGIFTNGYWGHPAMKLSPEVNLLAVAHYLQALEVQRKANKIVSILGSKTPHIQNVAVGGVANPIATDSQSVLTVERLMAVKGWIDELADFVKNVYLIDVAAIGAFYADWTKIGDGVTNYLVRARHSARHQGHAVRLARRLHRGRRPRPSYKPIKSFNDEYWIKGVEEAVKHSWYNYDKAGAAASLQGRDQAELHRLQGRRQVFLAQVADLLRQGGAGRPAGARAEHAGRRPRADQEVRHRGARHGLGAGQDQGRPRRHAFDHRPPRRARRSPAAVQVDMLADQWTALVDQHRQGRHRRPSTSRCSPRAR